MISDGTFYRWQNGDLLLFCHLQPQASRDEFAGTIAGSADIHVERLKIRITAPPVDGRANIHLIAFLAKQFGVAKRAVTISSGDSSRQKTVRIAQPAKLPAALSIAPPPVTL